MSTPLVEMRDVHVTYRKRGIDFPALQGVSFSVQAGERIGVVGGSGSGKSTIARTLLGLVRISAGEVWFDGSRVDGQSERRLAELRSRASMVFQDPNSSLNPRMNLRRIVSEPLRSPRLKRRGNIPVATKQVVADALAAVGLAPELMSRYPHQLSGGQRQRVAIARALVSEPDLLIADEPVSALDVSVRAQVLNLMWDAAEARDLALLLVSHDLAVVRHMCHRVIVVDRGQIVECGPTKALFENPEHDYTRSLLDAMLSV